MPDPDECVLRREVVRARSVDRLRSGFQSYSSPIRRVSATNSLLRSADGTTRLYFNPPSVPGMKDLIEDIERVEWKESGQGLNDAGGQRTDETDALSYMPYNFHPVHIRQPKVTRH